MADKDDITDEELEAIYDKVDAEIARHPPTDEELMQMIERMNDGVEEKLPTPTTRDRFLGCLLGGAVGDALGAPVEFLSLATIRRTHGQGGIRDFAPAYGRKGAITDDTQMTLFTAEGLIRALVRLAGKGITTYPGVTAHAYQRWLRTQDRHSLCETVHQVNCDGWLMGHRELHERRAPGNTCLGALRQMKSFSDNDMRSFVLRGATSADLNVAFGLGHAEQTLGVGLAGAMAGSLGLAAGWHTITYAMLHVFPPAALFALVATAAVGWLTKKTAAESRKAAVAAAVRHYHRHFLTLVDAENLAELGGTTLRKAMLNQASETIRRVVAAWNTAISGNLTTAHYQRLIAAASNHLAAIEECLADLSAESASRPLTDPPGGLPLA